MTAKSPTRPSPPAGLGKRGAALWRTVWADLPDDWELDQRERELLRLACEQTDELELLRQAIIAAGVSTTGSRGQEIVAPAVAEARQAREAIRRLLGSIDLPTGADGAPESAASARARKAARSRWDRTKGAA